MQATQSITPAGLRYVTDDRPGISRVIAKKSVRYLASNGHSVREKDTLERIRSLVIPPKWQNVWICTVANGHLQATGRDAKGRKQYIYHPRYRAAREETKYAKLVLFGNLLPRIRERVQHDLSSRGLSKEKVLAAVVSLMDLAQIRIGNEEYARANQSFGLTTLRDRHVEVKGDTLRFRFRGKSGKEHALEITDRRLAPIVRRCRDLPGYELFQYVNESGEPVSIDSAMVNDYLREISGEDITAKDFRTWHGTVEAAVHLRACEASSETEIKRNLVGAIKQVAERLGNRPATCRKYYVHPAVIEAYSNGRLSAKMITRTKRSRATGLSPEEKCVLKLLERPQRKKAA